MNLALSPDDQRLAVSARDDDNIWVIQKPYDVSKNGQRFLIPVDTAGSQSLTIVTNWTTRAHK